MVDITPPTPDRRFVVVPRDPRDAPKEPVRIPRHFCMNCGQRSVPCAECKNNAPMVDVYQGIHIGKCDVHSAVIALCPIKVLEHQSGIALPGMTESLAPGETIQATPEAAAQTTTTEQAEKHSQKTERIAVAITIALFIGFIAGVLLTIGATFFLSRVPEAKHSRLEWSTTPERTQPIPDPLPRPR